MNHRIVLSAALVAALAAGYVALRQPSTMDGQMGQVLVEMKQGNAQLRSVTASGQRELAAATAVGGQVEHLLGPAPKGDFEAFLTK